MRWDGLSGDGDEQGELLAPGSIPGLVRSVTTPEFAGMTFHEVRARSVLNAVPAGSAMPFRWTVNPYRGCSHACVYCLVGDTLVLMADGSQRPLADLRPGDVVVGTEQRGTYRHYVTTEVLAHWSTVKPAHRVRLQDGTELVASGEHRFLTRRGWKHVTDVHRGQRPHLTTNDELLGFGRTGAPPTRDADYRRGYLTGMVRGDAHLESYHYSRAGRQNGGQHRFRLALADVEALDRTQEYLGEVGVPTARFDFSPASPTRRAMTAIRTSRAAAVQRIRELTGWPPAPCPSWRRGFLAGIFDAEGGRSQHVLRITNADDAVLQQTVDALTSFGFDTVLDDRGLADRVRNVRLRGGLREHLRFVHLVDPAIRRKCGVDGIALKSDAALRVTSVEALGVELPMYDITTGTGDFIANGVVSHNCYARGSHAWLDLDTGAGFDQEIVVKVNAAERLAAEVARRGWAREHVALGTNTDPYQRAEGRYRLMPGIIEALRGSGTPFSVLTKGTLLRRDLPLLAAASVDVPVGLGVSVAVWDEALHRAVEPGAPSPRARLDLVRAVRDAGLPCGVFMAPVLPGLTDSAEHLDAALAALADAGATGVTVLPLHLRPGAREWWLAWLARERPDLLPLYRELYGRGAYVPRAYRDALAARVTPLLERHGLAGRRGGEQRGVRPDEGDFPTGSLPDGTAARPRRAPAPAEEAAVQLSLL